MLHEVGDEHGEYRRFPATGCGENAERTFPRLNDRELTRGEVSEIHAVSE